MKPIFGKLGSVSSGTLRTEDIMVACLDVADTLTLTSNDRKTVQKIRKDWNHLKKEHGDFPMDDLPQVVEDDLQQILIPLLNYYSPPFCYFGSNQGSSADIGWWVVRDLEEEVDEHGGIYTNDLDKVTPEYCGFVVVVNDHSNMTLYYKWCRQKRYTEIWSVV